MLFSYGGFLCYGKIKRVMENKSDVLVNNPAFGVVTFKEIL